MTPQTTKLPKTLFEHEEALEDFPGRTVPPIKVQRGDTLARILARLGAQSWQVRAMLEASRPIFAEASLLPGFEVRAIVLPSLARPAGEPVRFSVFDETGNHKVTVSRNVAGEYVPSATPTEERIAAAALLGEGDQVQDNSLYSSLHYTAAKQGVSAELINQIMRVHASRPIFASRCASATVSSSSSI